MLADSGLIEGWCAYASVNPQVVLTLLELDGAQVTRGWQVDLPREQRERAVEALVVGLASRFYWHLYAHGERSGASRVSPPSVWLADGSAVELSLASSGGYAVLSGLAPGLTAADMERVTDATEPSSFVGTWARLFPGSDPLDDRLSITPAALPPADLFQFPLPIGQTWWFNGAHNWHGSGTTYGRPYSSIDFFTSADKCSLPPANDWSVAAAGGSGYHPSGYECWYRIDHGAGWTTSYYHLRNTAPNGAIAANGKVGTIACETCAGGFATGPHVHFSLLYNGAYVDLEGVQLSGWTIRSGNGDYVSGGLERNGAYLAPYSSVVNDGTPAHPAPTDTPTPSPTPTPTPTPGSASAGFLYPPVGGLIRICPVKLVADAQVPGGVSSVTFWAKIGGALQQVGQDWNGSDGWQAEWDCQDAPDGQAVLSLSVQDAGGQEVIQYGAPTAVSIRKDCADGTYRTAFFANPSLDGAAASSWCKASAIEYRWGTGSPGAGVPGSDNFSARFRGKFWFEGGIYRFTGESDDGVRVWVDRALTVDGWRDRPGAAELFEFDRLLSAGLHEVRLDYYERSASASVRLEWQRVGTLPVRTYLPLTIRASSQ